MERKRIHKCVEMKEMYRKSPSLMALVVRPDNIEKAIKKVKKNKGAPGIDGMKVSERHAHFAQYFSQITKKLLDGIYQPQAVRKVQIPKSNGKMRVLGIPVARDRVIQQAIRQVIEPGIDRTFSNHSHGFRPRRSTGTALKQCAAYYEEGYKIAADCDLKQCFDMLNHDKLMYLFERRVQDKSIPIFIRRSLQVGAIDIWRSRRKKDRCTTRGRYLSLKKFNAHIKEITKRNRPGTFKYIITEINQVTKGWINDFARGFIRGFIETTQSWLNRRLRQLILKRWKRVRTKYKMLHQYGLDHRSSMKIAQSRKKY